MLMACGGGGGLPEESDNTLSIKQLDHDVRTPSNITVAFKVETANGEPVAGLQTGDFNSVGAENNNFEIWENDRKISQDESTAKIDPDSGDFDYYVYMLLDLSQSILNNSLDQTKLGAKTLVENLFAKGFRANSLKVKIAFFDGSDAVQVIQNFTNDASILQEKIDEISTDISNDPSTNLYGAVIKGVEELNSTIVESQISEEKYIVAGSLILFTDGTDQASRNTYNQALDAVNNANSNAKIFAIGLGGETDEDVLQRIGKDGYKKAEDAADLADTFGQIADLIVQETDSYYVLRYCSPKRGGANNSLKLVAKRDGLIGEMLLQFNAENFVSGCFVE